MQSNNYYEEADHEELFGTQAHYKKRQEHISADRSQGENSRQLQFIGRQPQGNKISKESTLSPP